MPGISLCFIINIKETTTLAACDNVVPSAAPAVPSFNTPIKIKSSAILNTHATVTKYTGLFESPIPRKTELIIL